MKHKSIILLLLWFPLMLHAQSHLPGYDEFVEKLHEASVKLKKNEKKNVKKYLKPLYKKYPQLQDKSLKVMTVYSILPKRKIRNTQLYVFDENIPFSRERLLSYFDVEHPCLDAVTLYNDSIYYDIYSVYLDGLMELPEKVVDEGILSNINDDYYNKYEKDSSFVKYNPEEINLYFTLLRYDPRFSKLTLQGEKINVWDYIVIRDENVFYAKKQYEPDDPFNPGKEKNMEPINFDDVLHNFVLSELSLKPRQFR